VYVIKVKGVAKIPDYIQLRDENFTLIAYFRLDRPEKALEKCGLTGNSAYILDLIKHIPFGKLVKLEI